MLDLSSFPGTVRKNEILAAYSCFGTGGPADFLVFPEKISAVSDLLSESARNHVPCLVVGKASNILFSDNGFRGVVIRLDRLKEDFRVTDDVIHAPSGKNLNDLIKFAAYHSLSGLEFLAGIPGTVGGAVYMNAGSPEKGIGDLVESVEFVDREGKKMNWTADRLEFGYRRSFFSGKKYVITACTIRLVKRARSDIINEIRRIREKKKRTQPLDCQTLGSVFKNPPNCKAWEIIESAGCRKLKIGGVEVSEKHCNFFVNRSKGNSKDMVELIKLVRHRVYSKYGIELVPEIIIIDQYGEVFSI